MYDEDDIDKIKYILEYFDGIDTAYYNKKNINYPDYNPSKPLDQEDVRLLVNGRIQISFEQLIRLLDKKSNTVSFLSKDEERIIRKFRNIISHDYEAVKIKNTKYLVLRFIPHIKEQFENVIKEYERQIKNQQQQKNESEDSPGMRR